MWVHAQTIKNMFEEAIREFDTKIWIKPNRDWQQGREPTREEIDEFLGDLKYKILKFQQSEQKTHVQKVIEKMGEDEKTIEKNSKPALTTKERAEQSRKKYDAAYPKD